MLGRRKQLILGCLGVGVEYISELDGVGEGGRDVRNGVFRFVCVCLSVSTMVGLILGCLGVGVEYISESDGV